MKIKLLVLVGFLYVTCAMLTSNLDKQINKYYKTITHPSVFDIGYYYLPNLSKYEFIGNFILLLFLIIVLILPKLWDDFLGYMITIVFIRLFFIHMTVLPKHRNCKLVKQNYFFGGCYDKIFSGHFAILCLVTLLLLKYKYLSLPWVIAINILYICLLLLFRWHYTIDMVVAFMVTLFVVQNDINIIHLLK
jgi:hypothetical protein